MTNPMLAELDAVVRAADYIENADGNVCLDPGEDERIIAALRTHHATIRDLAKRLEECEQECREEARLNGMGSEREAALMARLEAAERDAADEYFNGDNKHLCRSIKALLDLDADGALVPHGIGGHARAMLTACVHRLTGEKL